MIERHNAKVKEQDTVYFLGDVVINKRYLELVKRMNGRKILVRGNHDIFGDDDYYSVGFEQIHGVRVFVDKFILSHIPLHPDCVTERFRVNVHGHLHANQVMRPGMKQWIEKQTKTLGTIEYETDVFRADYSPEPDPRYLCVCVEQTDYTPIHFDEVEKRIQQRWENAEYTGPVKAWGNGSGPN
jgi:calcineurin-like phosphoesterase family protein